jgi:uncharacterized protein YndB with AHSA1/START domain
VSDTLEFTIDIAATRETVFAFLTESALFKEWMGSSSEMTVGDRTSFNVRYPTGDEAVGDIVEAIPPSRVVYTWGYRDGRHGLAPHASRVVIELTAIPTGTRLSLRHEGLPSEPVRIAHLQGWSYYFGVLSARAADLQTSGAVDTALAAWIDAWSTGDSAALERCCDVDVVYVDRLTHTRGRTPLGHYIHNARAFAPAARLHVAGPTVVTQTFVRFDWQMHAGDHTLGSGSAFGELSLQGQFVRVVSFWNDSHRP